MAHNHEFMFGTGKRSDETSMFQDGSVPVRKNSSNNTAGDQSVMQNTLKSDEIELMANGRQFRQATMKTEDSREDMHRAIRSHKDSIGVEELRSRTMKDTSSMPSKEKSSNYNADNEMNIQDGEIKEDESQLRGNKDTMSDVYNQSLNKKNKFFNRRSKSVNRSLKTAHPLGLNTIHTTNTTARKQHTQVLNRRHNSIENSGKISDFNVHNNMTGFVTMPLSSTHNQESKVLTKRRIIRRKMQQNARSRCQTPANQLIKKYVPSDLFRMQDYLL